MDTGVPKGGSSARTADKYNLRLCENSCRRRSALPLPSISCAPKAGRLTRVPAALPKRSLTISKTADALVVRSATKVTAASDRRRTTPACYRARGHRRGQRGRLCRQRPWHRRHERARRQQRERRGTGDGICAGARPAPAGGRCRNEAGQMGKEEVPRRGSAGQGARTRRPWTHRPGGRPPRRWIRHAAHRARPVHLRKDRVRSRRASSSRSTTCSCAPTTCRYTCRRTRRRASW